MPAVSFLLFDDELRTRSTCRGAGNHGCKGNLCYYADRAWLLFLFSATSFSRLVLRLFVVIGIVDSFHEKFSIVDLIRQSRSEKGFDVLGIGCTCAHPNICCIEGADVSLSCLNVESVTVILLQSPNVHQSHHQFDESSFSFSSAGFDS